MFWDVSYEASQNFLHLKSLEEKLFKIIFIDFSGLLTKS